MEDVVHPFGRKKRDIARIQTDYCMGCGWCAQFCVMECIHMREDGVYVVNEKACIGCRSCYRNCLNEAVILIPPNEVR